MDDRSPTTGAADGAEQPRRPVAVDPCSCFKRAMDAALNELIQDLASTAVPAATHLDQERYSALVSLTEKQRRYIVLLCDERELSVAQMADEMGTTVSAVEKCSRAVRKKLRVRTALALALVAMRAGLVK